MDKHTLTTIVITAFISVAAKEVASFFIKGFIVTAKAAGRTVVKHWAFVDAALAGLSGLFQIVCAFMVAETKSSLTGRGAFMIALLICLGFWLFRECEYKLLLAIRGGTPKS